MPKILLVEDYEIIRDLLARRLQQLDYEVIVAANGEQGVGMARSEAPDLILLDMGLPVLDGWEVTVLLKAEPTTRSIPIIAITAFPMPGDREKAICAGCDEYETKPIDFPQLLWKIRALLDRQAPS